jgi:aspartyl aminopeptidase
VAAHTDSPCPKLKPVSAASKAGFLNVGVQTYGAGLWHTWFDRDLSVAGRVLLRRENGTVVQELVKVERPIMRIPTLAIHLDRYGSGWWLFGHMVKIRLWVVLLPDIGNMIISGL